MIKDIITGLLFVENIERSKKLYEKLFQRKASESTKDFSSFRFTNTHLNFHLADQLSPLSKGGSVSYLFVENCELFLEKALIPGAPREDIEKLVTFVCKSAEKESRE